MDDFKPDAAPTCGVLCDDWVKALKDRNARGDGRRLEKHVGPVWGGVPMARRRRSRG